MTYFHLGADAPAFSWPSFHHLPPFKPEEALSQMGLTVPEEIDVNDVELQSLDELKETLINEGLPPQAVVDLMSFLRGVFDEPAVFAPLEEASSTEKVSTPVAGINPKDALGLAKVDLSVVPPSAELHLASAMMDGAVKYGPFNWRDNKVLARVYVAAARRHLLQFLDGENFDPVSKVHHLGHAMACCAILLDAFETGNLVDDRPTAGAAGEMIRRWSKESKLQ